MGDVNQWKVGQFKHKHRTSHRKLQPRISSNTNRLRYVLLRLLQW